MELHLKEIMKQVPDYQEFYTVEELDRHTFELAEKYPDCVTVEELGKSRLGKSIYCLIIGDGSKNALLYGAPHPNEPIGTMMLDALAQILAENKEFRRYMDYTWYLVKASDVDGLSLNEGWLKGPYSITNYQRHFFRPAFEQQVEWSFPVDYKRYHFHVPTPETQCLMKLIDRIQPKFVYSLHNSGFGGCYWYLADGTEELFKSFHSLSEKYEIPLKCGEAEVPYCKHYAEAIFQITGLEEQYDYFEKYMPDVQTENLLSGGGCSWDYIRRHCKEDAFFIVSEVPYYTNPKVSDTSVTDHNYLEEILGGSEGVIEDYRFCKEVCLEIAEYMGTDNQFYLSACEQCEMKGRVEARRQYAIDTIDPQTKATESQLFDIHFSHRFYSNLCIVLLRRACDWELQAFQCTKDGREKVQQARNKLWERETENLKYMESQIEYTTIPIQQLVKIQLESGLLYAHYVHDI